MRSYLALALLPFLLLATSCSEPISHNSSIPGCPIVDCGNGVNITYPLWVPPTGPNQPTSFCGYLDFMVTCDSARPSFQLFSDDYTVKSLDAATRTISLVDSEIAGLDCPRPRHNVSLDGIAEDHSVSFPPSVRFLLFFFNCSLTPDLASAIPEDFHVTCLRNVSGDSYVFSEENQYVPEAYAGLYEACRGGNIVSPVLSASLDSGVVAATAFGSAIGLGFEVRWKDSDMENCSVCEGSGGKCGYRNSTGGGWVFQCYCKDGVHSRACGGGNNSKKALTIGIGFTEITG